MALFLMAASVLQPVSLPALQDEASAEPTSAVQISAVRVEPANPAADTLCRLRIELENADERIASQLGFTVTINGQELPVYKNHLFMFPVSPGGKSELPLYNFWSTETSRPLPASGKLEIEVALREARWMDISTEDDTEVWKPLGDVTGLPVSRSITLEMAKGDSAD
ncbi:MAG: hypothetical protein ACE5GX_20155 [Thermoanaerobaculia bacterium]